MGGACGTYGGRERYAQGFGGETCGERDHWGDQDVDGRITLKVDFWEVGRSCGDWMELAQDRDGWRALLSTVMYFRVP